MSEAPESKRCAARAEAIGAMSCSASEPSRIRATPREARDVVVGRRDHEAARAEAEQPREHTRASLEGTVGRGARGAHGAAVADLDLVEVKRVPHGERGGGPVGASEREEGAGREAVEAAADLTALREALGDTQAGAEDLAEALHDGRGARFLAEVAVRVGAELAHALEEVLFPREEHDGDVAEREVTLEGTAKREAVEAGHDDVADDEVGRDLARETRRHARRRGPRTRWRPRRGARPRGTR